MSRQINENGRKELEAFEGRRPKMYQDSVGIWTIGVGHAISKDHEIAKALFPHDLSDIEIDALLNSDLEKTCKGVESHLMLPVSDNQFAALVSFAFNVGLGNFASSSLLKYINLGKFAQAANEFIRWNHAEGKVIAGLTTRRLAEKELFLRV